MFKDNKYTKIYFKIIESADSDTDDYFENHHIIPRCLGGSDEKDNIVRLTARKHFICHLLLTKMHDSFKLKYALYCMLLINPNQINKRYIPKNSRLYEYAKKCNSLAASQRLKGHEGHIKNKKFVYNTVTNERRYVREEEINFLSKDWKIGFDKSIKSKISKVQKGRKYYYDPKTLEVRSFKNTSDVPDGWLKGNPNADTSDANNLRNSKYYHNIKTGEEKRFLKKPSDNWKLGRSAKWITNGIESKQINYVIESVPKGWKFGRNNKKQLGMEKKSKYSNYYVYTPLGDYPIKTFCKKYKCSYNVLLNLDCRIRDIKNNKFLIKELEKVNYDFSKTKKENGFSFKIIEGKLDE